MKVVHEFENKLLKRKEIRGVVEGEGSTVTRKALVADVAKSLKVDESLVVVKNISSHFGDLKMDVTVHVYETREGLEKIESEHFQKRNTFAADAPAEEPAQEEAPAAEAAPTEEATEAESSEEAPAEPEVEAEEEKKEAEA